MKWLIGGGVALGVGAWWMMRRSDPRTVEPESVSSGGGGGVFRGVLSPLGDSLADGLGDTVRGILRREL